MFGARSCEETQTGQTFLRHAISADGSRAIWTHIQANECEPSVLALHPSELLMRIDGSETVQLDARQSGGGTSGNGLFWAASSSGSVVYFTSPNRLISGARAEPREEDLYRYDFNATPPLTDLTSGGGKGSVPGDVQGVLGASDDGSRIYFVAQAALTTPADTGAAGEHAEPGKDNVYLYDATEDKTSFIATLSGEDNLDWESQPRNHAARVTPDGRYLAFLSVEAKALAGYDNTVAKGKGRFGGGEHCQLNEIGKLIGGAACPEAFLYDAQTKSLRCASCNPSGGRPLGPASMPGWTNMAEGPRYLSDDGRRLFFESFDRLLPADESPVRDVYEFELPGAGSCDAANVNFDPASGACLFLVSSGHSSDENHLIDASANGNDVFFSTRERLLPGRDPNGNYDIYDYRVGGGFAEPAEEEICESERSCMPSTPTPPPAASPATPNVGGVGNPKPRSCRKGFERRAGKCVRSHRRKKHHGRRHARHHRKKGKARKHAAARKGRAGR
jgi:hypothetical protein